MFKKLFSSFKIKHFENGLYEEWWEVHYGWGYFLIQPDKSINPFMYSGRFYDPTKFKTKDDALRAIDVYRKNEEIQKRKNKVHLISVENV